MRVLVIGGGGREHTIIKKLKESKKVTEIFALPGNGGIAFDATCVPISATDADAIVCFAKENNIEYAVVAPDDPLVWAWWTAWRKSAFRASDRTKTRQLLRAARFFPKI